MSTLQHSSGRKIYGVTDLNRMARSILEDEIGEIWIEGEISGLKQSQPGHIYFSLKDAKSVINAALFRGDRARVQIELTDGMHVYAFGRVTLYEPGGRYQIIVRHVEEVGRGDLQKAFEELKAKLAQEGLFDQERKRSLPLLPRCVGIVTSPTGAAIRDILQVLERRFPNLPVLVAPTAVQGKGSAEEIARAIEDMNRLGRADVMIVGRGGGSLEDLWSFNEEVVARAIATSSIPIISAVGHETDVTIADFVADLRAPTPSAAAELVVQQKAAFHDALSNLQRSLARALRTHMLEIRNRFDASARSYVFKEPRHLVRQHRQHVAALRSTLASSMRNQLRTQMQRIDEGGLKLSHAIDGRMKTCTQDVRRIASQLRALSPRAVLERGYSITRTAGGRVVTRPAHVQDGDVIENVLAEGVIESTVTKSKGRHA